MNFIELTSLIDDEQGYADDPEFQSDIWPLLRRSAKEIDGVFLFRNHRSRGFGWLGPYQVVSQNIVRIQPMAELTDDELDKIKLWSFYAGHLNVLYSATSESSLVRELCRIYPTFSLSSDDIDQLALDPEPLTELRAFTAALPKEVVHFAFAHDGDPLFMFGELETLRALLRSR